MTPQLKRYARQLDGTMKPATGKERPMEVGGEEGLNRLYDRLATIPWKMPAPRKANGAFYLTDMGNAERLAERYGHAIRYCHERKSWLVWNGMVWEWDTGAKIGILAKLTVRSIYHEAANEDDKERRSDIASHAKKSESDHRINAMINLTRSEPGIPIEPIELDTNPWALNCLNGTLDLKTGKLLRHNPEDLNTIIIPVAYDPEAQCPMWLEFIKWATSEDTELATYLQRALGYSLTGDISEQIMFFLFGLGMNGKSTLTMTIRSLMAGYGIRLDADDLMIKDRKSSGPKESLANLFKRRYVLGSEVRDGRRLDVGQLKDWTGGETVKADRKYEHQFEFMPSFKLWLYGNKKPTIADNSLAVWRRVKMIEFKQRVPDDKIDKRLAEKLEAELPGILAWAVRGCLDWQNEGFNDAKAVRDATETYRHEQDALRDYIDDHCSTEPSDKVLKSELRRDYEAWCIENKVDTINQRPFKAALEERGITSIRGTANKAYWKGIRLLSEKEMADRDRHQAEIEAKTSDEKLPKLPKLLNLPETPIREDLYKKLLAEPVTLVTKVTSVTDKPLSLSFICPNCKRREYWVWQGSVKKCSTCWTPPEGEALFEDD
jgi:putative DNA primase/helicase